MDSIASLVVGLLILAFLYWKAVDDRRDRALRLVVEMLDAVRSVVNRQITEEDIRSISGEVYDSFFPYFLSIVVPRDAFVEYCVDFVRHQLGVSHRVVAMIRGK